MDLTYESSKLLPARDVCEYHLFHPAELSKNTAENHKQRTLLNCLLILACLALGTSGHEAGRSSTNYIRKPFQGPIQAPLLATKRISASGSDITTFVDELGPQLSSEASITLVGADEFDELTVRWTAWEAPSFQATVQVYTEEDVSNTVIFILQTKDEHVQLTLEHRLKFRTSSNFLGWLSLAAMEELCLSASSTLEFRSTWIIWTALSSAPMARRPQSGEVLPQEK